MARQRNASTNLERPRTGARGALLDEYERAIQELKRVIADLDDASLAVELYPNEADPDCRSIGTILEHVVRAGNGYPTLLLRKRSGDDSIAAPRRKGPPTAEAFCSAMDDMFAYAVETLAGVGEGEMMHKSIDKLVVAPWGQRFDYDQLMEHAIVHILRHRRQIERFKRELGA